MNNGREAPEYRWTPAIRVFALALLLVQLVFGFQPELRRLAAGDVIEAQLRGGESHAYVLSLRAGQFIDAVADQKGIDLEAVLFLPDGRVAAHSDLPNRDRGPEPIAAIAEVTGDYRLVLRPISGRAAPGRYELRVNAIRTATPEDRRHADAERLIDEALVLEAKRGAAEMQAALEKNRTALAYFQLAGDRYRQALTLNSMGIEHASLGDYRSALTTYESARELLQTVDDPIDKAMVLNNEGGAYNVLGDLTLAMRRFQEALPLFEAAGQGARAANTLNNIGVLYADMADYQRATEFYQRALPVLEQLGDRGLQAAVLHNLGVANQFIDPERAIDFFKRALEMRRALGDRPGEASTLANLGGQYYTLGRLEEAIRYEQEALGLERLLGNLRGVARAQRTLGQALAKRGDQDQALTVLQDSVAAFRAMEDRRGESMALAATGQAQMLAGKPDAARGAYRQAASIAEQIGDTQDLGGSIEGIARAERDLGNLTEAKRNGERALQLIEKVRINAGGGEARASYLSTALESYEFSIDVLMRMEDPAAALETSERSRARSLVEMLADTDIRTGVDPKLIEREREITNTLNAKGSRLLPLKAEAPQAVALQKEIRGLETEYQDVEAAIRKNSPGYAALTQPSPLKVSEIQQKLLDEDTLLLEYSLGGKRSYLWAVGKNELRAWELPGRDQIEAQVEQVVSLLTARSIVKRLETAAERHKRIAAADAALATAASTLSRMVIGPAEGVLGARKLVVVPDGALQRLPFSMLPAGEGEPLIATHEVVMLPSASALAVLRREISGRKPASKMLAVFADPVFDWTDARAGKQAAGSPAPLADSRAGSRIVEHLADPGETAASGLKIPRLPYTAQEADRILGVARSGANLKAVGFQASRAAAISGQLSDYRYLHFATHGFLDTERPSLSALVLSQIDENNQPEDGFLRVNDIYNSRLAAELVVLSACQTGLGQEVRGEGLMGLTRAFLYAGAPRVIVSLWNVNDRATAELMTSLYRSMLREGKRPSAALRQAQLEMRKQKQWESPYYWAAFVQHGEWR